MSTQYNGNAANTYATRPPTAGLAINSSTNSSPIVVTTVNPHGLSSNDSVVIGGHLVNTAANGRWIVTVLSAYTFSLAKISGAASVGNGAGVTTGTVWPQTMGATYPDPSDGDNDNAASVDVAFQALGDRSAYTGRQLDVNGYQVVRAGSFSIADAEPPVFTVVGTITGSGATGLWKPLMVSGSQYFWTIPNLCQSDLVLLDMTTSLQQNFNANALYTLFVQQVSAGGTIGTLTRLGGTGQVVNVTSTTFPLHLKALATMGAFGASADPGGSLLVALQGFMPGAGDIATLYSELELAYMVLRPNG